ncbi:MAG: hypothetical protein EAX91_16645 [Candidatus Lokiarchaeota archaeon]|nr:hypothetical protein [Candidatus Lokiarchaeota archaeon]
MYQLFKLGRELGLTNKDIIRVLFLDNTRNKVIFTIILVIIFFTFGYFIILLVESAISNTYPTGSRYSTVKLKDFDKKR